ncbi:IclR family transcriptional regulator [Enterococcus sp. CSURQ0835]|uniref:IclR family transcriptional regulator n=1 Tax=Enterococcus sp. CSURQ0835 TaxID=2681394 RepID=UPI00135990AA|nr:IclR family transcriptional regulator [Enterococcus sp. CSURQ0835]
MAEKKPYGTVLIRAAKIMDFLAVQPDQTLQAIAQATEMTASTTIKILETLVSIHYVQKGKDKTYRLGAKLVRYANKRLEQIDLSELTLPYFEKLQQQIDETIHLGVLNADEVLYINKLEPKNQTIRMSSKVGITRPLYNSAMGKAILAEFTDPEIEQYLATHSLAAMTKRTITQPAQLWVAIDAIRQTGVAYDDEEVERDIFCSAVTLKKGTQILGAFSISMPKYRLTEEKKQLINHELLATKACIEQAIP